MCITLLLHSFIWRRPDSASVMSNDGHCEDYRKGKYMGISSILTTGKICVCALGCILLANICPFAAKYSL